MVDARAARAAVDHDLAAATARCTQLQADAAAADAARRHLVTYTPEEFAEVERDIAALRGRVEAAETRAGGLEQRLAETTAHSQDTVAKFVAKVSGYTPSLIAHALYRAIEA